MNWYHRGERRYVEYGSSLPGLARVRGRPLAHRHGLQHEPRRTCSRDAPTVFEHARRRRRAHRRHDLPDLPRPPPPRARPARRALTRAGQAAQFRHAGLRARASSSTPTCSPRARRGCRSQLGLPGAARPALRLRRRLPRRARPVRLPAALAARQRHPLAPARARTRQVDLDRRGRPRSSSGSCTPAGGADAFLDEHAVIVMADHSQTHGRGARSTSPTRFAELARAGARPTRPRPRPSSRSARRSARAMVYALDPSAPRRAGAAASCATLRGARGRRPALWRAGDAARRAIVGAARRAALRARAATCATRAARRWGVDGELGALELARADGVLRSRRLPGRARPRSGRRSTCPTSGDVLLSAAPGYEFVDWGGADHVGGGSHGSLHRGDSRGRAAAAAASTRAARAQWSLRDVAADGARPLRCPLRRRERRARCATSATGPHRAARPGARTACASRRTGCSSCKFCVVGARGYVVNLAVFALCVHGARRRTTSSPPRSPSWSR